MFSSLAPLSLVINPNINKLVYVCMYICMYVRPRLPVYVCMQLCFWNGLLTVQDEVLGIGGQLLQRCCFFGQHSHTLEVCWCMYVCMCMYVLLACMYVCVIELICAYLYEEFPDCHVNQKHSSHTYITYIHTYIQYTHTYIHTYIHTVILTSYIQIMNASLYKTSNIP